MARVVSIASSRARVAALVRVSLICLLKLGMPRARIMQRMVMLASSSIRVNPWDFITYSFVVSLNPFLVLFCVPWQPFIRLGMPYVALTVTPVSVRDRLH